MAYTERFTERNAVLEQSLVPLLRANGTYTTAYVSGMDYHRYLIDIYVGALAAGATLDAQVYQATTTAGAGAKVITGKAITQLTQAGGDTNCGHVFIEVRGEELDTNGNFDCLGVTLVGGVGNTTWGVTIYGIEPRHAPASVTALQEVVD